ncbi:MAG: lipoyl(octanoyl) transferase [Bacteroidetes bacterium]|nr:MAG: lipoyl(octanoyl) transferase [Bacteroidota bacterium]
MAKQLVIFKDIGRVDYQEAWDLQTVLNKELITSKRSSEDGIGVIPHQLLFCEHPAVYTLGRSGSENHLMIDKAGLEAIDAKYYKINRGGDITFHGPGQVVGYPIFDLDRFFTDVHKYVRALEEVVIRLLASYDIEGHRIKEYTGVWLSDDNVEWRKICAIGVHLSRWVTMHGFALNVNTDLSYFSHIVPCGIDAPNTSVTTLQIELGREVSIAEVKSRLKDIFAEVFDFDYTN